MEVINIGNSKVHESLKTGESHKPLESRKEALNKLNTLLFGGIK
jgi:hypothetical protein